MRPGATHMLPHIWTTPTSFDPDRFAAPREEHKRAPYALVGFGGGPRICIGRAVARTELALLVAGVLRHYRLTGGIRPDHRTALRRHQSSRSMASACAWSRGRYGASDDTEGHETRDVLIDFQSGQGE